MKTKLILLSLLAILMVAAAPQPPTGCQVQVDVDNTGKTATAWGGYQSYPICGIAVQLSDGSWYSLSKIGVVSYGPLTLTIHEGRGYADAVLDPDAGLFLYRGIMYKGVAPTPTRAWMPVIRRQGVISWVTRTPTTTPVPPAP